MTTPDPSAYGPNHWRSLREHWHWSEPEQLPVMVRTVDEREWVHVYRGMLFELRDQMGEMGRNGWRALRPRVAVTEAGVLVANPTGTPPQRRQAPPVCACMAAAAVRSA